MDVQFLVNARRETVNPRGLKFDGHLVPPAYLTRRLRQELTGSDRTWRGTRIVDNGLYDDISRIIKRAELDPTPAVAALLADNTLERRSRAALPQEVRTWVDAVIAFIQQQANAVVPFPLAEQLALKPTAIVGLERIQRALWFGAAIEPSWIARGYQRLKEFNRQIASKTIDQNRRTTVADVLDMPVAAATDYDSAYAAGEIFGKAGIRAAAIPFGGFMADERFASSMRVRGRIRLLPKRLPARALRSALVARGFMDGWLATGARAPSRLHLLGLGQPLVLGVVLLALRGVRVVSCDATSAFKDSTGGDLYTEIPVFRRLNGDAILRRILVVGDKEWNCPCPFCQSVSGEQQWARARVAIRRLTPVELKDALRLNRESVLSPLLPYFSLSSPNRFWLARAMHNHWVTQRCISRLDRAAGTSQRLRTHVTRLIQAYEQSAVNTNYAGVYPLAREMALGTW
jgi:hypothetical protein